MAENFEGLRTNYQLLTDPRYAAIRMTGQEVSPQSYATAVWNAESGKLFLDAGNLPETASDKQYQLWAIVEGVGPVSAGVFDPETELLDMPDISGEVTAFAVTLEPRGGSESPTLEQMYVLGGV
jgi:anti-sigma-K factor RskA